MADCFSEVRTTSIRRRFFRVNCYYVPGMHVYVLVVEQTRLLEVKLTRSLEVCTQLFFTRTVIPRFGRISVS